MKPSVDAYIFFHCWRLNCWNLQTHANFSIPTYTVNTESRARRFYLPVQGLTMRQNDTALLPFTVVIYVPLLTSSVFIVVCFERVNSSSYFSNVFSIIQLHATAFLLRSTPEMIRCVKDFRWIHLILISITTVSLCFQQPSYM